MKIHEEITSSKHILHLNLKELWDYRDLLLLFVRRDFVATYKQTVLGPIWFFIQPIFTTIIFTIVFGTLAEISTDGIPPVLFYMAGITCWNYFSACLTSTANTFTANASIFGKVYFPRLILPLSLIVSNLIKFGIQFTLFFSVLIYYKLTGYNLSLNSSVLFLPVLILLMGGLGLGFGIIISSLTTKYRDFQFLVGFGVQLFMYATPVVYPLSLAKEKMGSYFWMAEANPLTSIIESLKSSFLLNQEFDWHGLLYSFSFMTILLLVGVIIFNRVEQTFMDTV